MNMKPELTEEQIADNAAAVVAFLREEEVRYKTSPESEWLPCPNPSWNFLEFQYRPAPWTLGRSVNGFTLVDGQEWHRQDWTKEMLPEGWRPLIVGEDGVEYEFYYRSKWGAGSHTHGNPLDGTKDFWHRRTRRPLPVPTRPWSKPEDVPGTVCWLRTFFDKTSDALIIATDRFGIYCVKQADGSNTHVGLVTWKELQSGEHSTDRITWKPCQVQP